MRGKKAILNTAASLLIEIIIIINTFVVPRFILSVYGSEFNGLINSITQFLSCAVLLRSGIGGATKAALYKPLSEKNIDEVSAIILATEKFMKKIGIILAGLILLFASLYPFLVRNTFNWAFTFTLFLIIGTSTFAESFFGITYFTLLAADQNSWVYSVFRSICYIISTIISVLLILNGIPIHIVKMVDAIIFVLYPVVTSAYVKNKYKLKRNVAPNQNAISQRWDAFWQQISTFVMYNTDTIVLTAFSTIFEVSVYSVYNMITYGLKKFIFTFTEHLEGAFGNMIAKKETGLLKTNFSLVETATYALSTVIFSTAGLVILDFVKLYTISVTDTNYIRPLFAVLMLTGQFINCVRFPYQLIVQAAGHYKQTKKGAIFEPILNISLSVIFVFKFGLIGVTIGTLAAVLFRTVQYSFYMSEHLIKRSQIITLLKFLLCVGECLIILYISSFINFGEISNYYNWIIKAIIIASISCIIVFTGNFIFFRKDVINLIKKVKKYFFQKKKYSCWVM